jgi:hypothetical protein
MPLSLRVPYIPMHILNMPLTVKFPNNFWGSERTEFFLRKSISDVLICSYINCHHATGQLPVLVAFNSQCSTVPTWRPYELTTWNNNNTIQV